MRTDRTIPFGKIIKLIILTGSAFASVVERPVRWAFAKARSLVVSLIVPAEVFVLVFVGKARSHMERGRWVEVENDDDHEENEVEGHFYAHC